MCVRDLSKILIANEDIECFKVVKRKGGIFISEYHPAGRETLEGFEAGNHGVRKDYILGERTKSNMNKTPGLFSYSIRPYFSRLWSDMKVLQCCIPKGARYRTGIAHLNSISYLSSSLDIISEVNANEPR